MWKWQAEGDAKGIIVLIHSAYEEHKHYAWQIEQWRRNGFHVYMGDLPGHGTQAADDPVHREQFYEYDKAAAELLRLATGNDLPIVLAGHGLGAAIAIHALAENRHPITALILTSPWFELQKVPSKPSLALSSISKLTGKGKIDHGIELRHLTRRKFQDESAGAARTIHSLSSPAWWKELQGYLEQATQTQLPDLPVMLHVGQRDLITRTAAGRTWLSKQAVNEFHFKEWPFCYHDLLQEPEREEIFGAALCFADSAVESENMRRSQ
ncbi:alpha/beta hydrolase [Planococcus maitriensis]|uniref:Alpha/beta hydrolase n=1 Tax=Planococcus maitriensis TaxID=221799 RepID=A0A365K1B4_9BACL|nr:alpha/beta hydrolase [Planococcus maitriensis]RAZ66269.1 alpha/beta hydrolase [Planococcus maitriensis]